MLLGLVQPAIEAVQIWLFKIVIDDVLIRRQFYRFPGLVAVYVALTIAMGVVSFADDILSTWLTERFLLDLRTDVFAHLHGLSLDFFEQARLGDLVSRLTGDISAIEDFVVSGINDAASYTARVLGFAVVLFVLDWRLALVSMVAAPLFWIAASSFSKRMKEASRERRRSAGSVSAVAEESLGNVALVQSYNRQAWEVDRFHQANRKKYDAELRAARLRATYRPVTDSLSVLGALLVIGFGTWSLAHGQLTTGGLIVFLTFLERLYSPIRGLGRFATSAFSAAAGAERVVELLDHPGTEARTTSRPRQGSSWNGRRGPSPDRATASTRPWSR